MTALSANKKRRIRGTPFRAPLVMLAADSIEIYEGSVLMDNGSGKLAIGADTSGAYVLGISANRYTTGTAANTYPVVERIGPDAAEWFAQDGNITAAMIGTWATLADDATASNATTTTNDVPMGRIEQLETIDGVSGVWLSCVGTLATIVAP
jgi:hypothetical protein